MYLCSFDFFIGQCGLGMKVNCQLDPNDQLLVMVKRSMKRQVFSPPTECLKNHKKINVNLELLSSLLRYFFESHFTELNWLSYWLIENFCCAILASESQKVRFMILFDTLCSTTTLKCISILSNSQSKLYFVKRLLEQSLGCILWKFSTKHLSFADWYYGRDRLIFSCPRGHHSLVIPRRP